MKKVLIITYYWPPGSGAGVQRWLKFSKYLPQYGWEPVILTVEPEYAAYPAVDNTLSEDIPAGLRIIKTKATDYFRLYKKDKSKIPSAGFAKGNSDGIKARLVHFLRGNLFIPDPRRGWNKFAFRKACEIIESEGINKIITTSPPHSTQLIGLRIKKRFPFVNWIADLRDPWTDIYYYSRFNHTPVARAIDTNYEKKVLRSADKLITVGRSLKDHFLFKTGIAQDKIEIITNGYDEDDFRDIEPDKPELFTISYIGTLSSGYPLDGFLKALRDAAGISPPVRFRFIGMLPDSRREIITSSAGKAMVEYLPYASHGKAVSFMTGSSALLLIIPDHKSNKCILTGKLFEYLASGRPVICLGPKDGDAALIINQTGSGRVFDYYNSTEIKDFILSLIKNPSYIQGNIQEYSRKLLTQKLSQILGS